MKRVLMLVLTVLFVSACDRFEHDVYSDANIEASFGQFDLSLSAANVDSLAGIMNWYSEDYLNDAETKSDVEHEYMSYFGEYGDSLILNAMNMEYWKTNRIVFEIWVNLPDTSFVIAEKEDFLMEVDGNYIFYGNQVAPPPSESGFFSSYDAIFHIHYLWELSISSCKTGKHAEYLRWSTCST